MGGTWSKYHTSDVKFPMSDFGLATLVQHFSPLSTPASGKIVPVFCLHYESLVNPVYLWLPYLPLRVATNLVNNWKTDVAAF